MTYMMCRTRFSDFSVWKAVFDSHEQTHRDAGLKLVNLWRCIEEPNNVFFMFEVADIDSADQFINSPASAKAGEVSGVIDGEYHYVESVPRY
jgi:hypothetical protein